MRDLGPLWSYSCFFYEDLNGDLRNLFHGTQMVHLQIAYALSVQINLPKLAASLIHGSPQANLHNKLTTYHHIKQKMDLIIDRVFVIHPLLPGESFVCENSSVAKTLTGSIALHKFARLFFNGKILHSVLYHAVTNRNSRCILFKTSSTLHYGEVQYYLKARFVNFVKYFAMLKIFNEIANVHSSSHMRVFNRETCEQSVIILVDDIIDLCVNIDIKDLENIYLAVIPNRFERD